MILFHGTNRRIRNLKIGSFLTAEFEDAIVYASNKEGDIIYEFDVKDCDIEKDIHSPGVNWFITKNKISPIHCYSI